MMKTIAIWGSTGVIGTKALQIAINLGYKVVALVGNSNHKLLTEQAKLSNPDYVGVAGKDAYTNVKDALNSNKIKVLPKVEFENLAKLDLDCCVMAISGHTSLYPTFSCLGHARKLAIASKEAIILGGSLLRKISKQNQTEIIPIDSEHSSIFQCLQGEKIEYVQELILTASGGAFANLEENELENVEPQDALKHPNWNMGAKNTIDSATLFNKALEIIEASYLFNFDIEKIKAIIHPNSIIHAIVKFIDNSYKSLLSYPDMNLPISYAINYPERPKSHLPELNFEQICNLQLKKPKAWQKRNIDLAYQAVKENKVIAFNMANEMAVSKFVNGELRFSEIYKYVIARLESSPEEKINSFEDINVVIKFIQAS